jgi:hypothetical protein
MGMEKTRRAGLNWQRLGLLCVPRIPSTALTSRLAIPAPWP